MLKAIVAHVAVMLISTSSASAVAQVASGQRQEALSPKVDPAQTPPEGPSGKIEISSTECNLGEVFQGADAIKAFTVKNVGEGPLTLSVRSSCGCTTPSKPKSPLPPGESTEFTIKYRTSNPGAFHKTVWLTTSDPDQQRITIPVEGLVKPLFSMTPGEEARYLYRFENAALDPNQTVTIVLTNNNKEPVHLKLADGQKFGRYDVALHETEPGQKYELRVYTVPPLDNGANQTAVQLSTDYASVPTLRLSLEAPVEPRVSFSPPRLQAVRGTDRVVRNVFVKYRKADPVKIESVTSDLDDVKIEFLDKANSPKNATANYYQLRVTLPEFDKIPEQGGKLIIKTDDTGEYATIEIPIERYQRPVTRAPQAQRSAAGNQAGAAPAKPEEKAHAAKPETPAKPEAPAESEDNQ